MSPFNIGRRILLTDFAPAEAVPLARGLTGGQAVLNRVLHWTNGHPYMTQRLCRAIAEQPGSVTPGAVDALCARLFLTKQASDTDDNLAFVRTRLLRSEVDLAALLDLYQQVRAGKKVKDDETNPLIPVLRLSGVVNAPQGLLRVRNRIYDQVFDRDWVQSHMPDAEMRRQATAFRRGVLRTASLAAVVLLLMAVLAGEALHQSVVARAAVQTARREARRADRSEAQARAEADKAHREAQAASAANAQAQAQKQNALHQQGLAQQQTNVAQRQTQLAVSSEQEAVRQRGRASVAAAQASAQTGIARRKEQEALRQKSRADQQKNFANTQTRLARRQRTLADQQKNLAEHTQRMADLQLAGQTWESPTGTASSVQDLLYRSAEAGGSSGTQRFEWRMLLNTLSAGSALTTQLDQGAAHGAAITANNDFVSIDEHNQLCITSFSKNTASKDTETTRRPLPDAATVSCTFFSPDGTEVGVERTNGQVDVYATDTLRQIDSWEIGSTPVLNGEFDPHTQAVVAWDTQTIVKKTLNADGVLIRASFPAGSQGGSIPQGSLISTDMHYVAAPADSQVIVTDLNQKGSPGSSPQVLSNGPSINGYCLSPAYSLLAMGDGRGRVSVWDMSTGKMIRSWIAQSGQIETVRFSPTSQSLAVGGQNGLVQLWQLGPIRTASSRKPVLVNSFKGHTYSILRLVFSAAVLEMDTGLRIIMIRSLNSGTRLPATRCER